MAEPRRPQLFFDTSALFAGVISAVGAARALLERSGLRIGTPGEALAWVREEIR